MIITEFEVEGLGARNGNFCIGSTLIYKGLQKDPWFHHFVVSGAPKFLFYFTEDCIISTSDGIIRRYGEIDLLRLPFQKSCLFFEQDRDNPEVFYRGYMSCHGVKWHTYSYEWDI
jgi:hypothetical protein